MLLSSASCRAPDHTPKLLSSPKEANGLQLEHAPAPPGVPVEAQPAGPRPRAVIRRIPHRIPAMLLPLGPQGEKHRLGSPSQQAQGSSTVLLILWVQDLRP